MNFDVFTLTLFAFAALGVMVAALRHVPQHPNMIRVLLALAYAALIAMIATIGARGDTQWFVAIFEFLELRD